MVGCQIPTPSYRIRIAPSAPKIATNQKVGRSNLSGRATASALKIKFFRASVSGAAASGFAYSLHIRISDHGFGTAPRQEDRQGELLWGTSSCSAWTPHPKQAGVLDLQRSHTVIKSSRANRRKDTLD